MDITFEQSNAESITSSSSEDPLVSENVTNQIQSTNTSETTDSSLFRSNNYSVMPAPMITNSVTSDVSIEISAISQNLIINPVEVVATQKNITKSRRGRTAVLTDTDYLTELSAKKSKPMKKTRTRKCGNDITNQNQQLTAVSLQLCTPYPYYNPAFFNPPISNISPLINCPSDNSRYQFLNLPTSNENVNLSNVPNSFNISPSISHQSVFVNSTNSSQEQYNSYIFK